MVKTYEVKLNEASRLQQFVNECIRFTDVTVIGKHEQFVVDAKSIMGLLSLDLTEPVTIEANAGTEAEFEPFNRWITDFNNQCQDN